MRLMVSNANFYQTNFQYWHRHITEIINYHKHCKHTLNFYLLVYLLIISTLHKTCNSVSEQPKRSRQSLTADCTGLLVYAPLHSGQGKYPTS